MVLSAGGVLLRWGDWLGVLFACGVGIIYVLGLRGGLLVLILGLSALVVGVALIGLFSGLGFVVR